jgi:Protein of unknown function (DUF2800)
MLSEIEVKQHALLSPSSAYRWLNCSAFIARSKDIEKKESTNEAALAGNKSHALAEQMLIEFAQQKAYFVVPDATKIDPYVSMYLKYVCEQFLNYQGVYLGECVLHVEKHLVELNYVGDDAYKLSGTVDCIIETPEFIDVIDLKTGYHNVNAENNQQLGLYAVIAQQIFNKKVRNLVIVQRDFVDEWQPTQEWLSQLANNVVDIQKQLNSGAFTYNAGNWCDYCPLKYSCAAYANSVAPIVATLPDPVGVDDERLTELYNISNFLKTYIATVGDEVNRRMIQNGRKLKGYKVVQGRGQREWARPENEILTLLTAEGFDFTELTELKSFTQVEKLSKKAKELVATLVHKKNGAYKVVRNDDEGEPVTFIGDSLPAIE